MAAPKLKHSPYAIFEDSQSPPGLYARQKWLNEGETETYRADFVAAVAKLRYAEVNSGTGFERILEKLHRLFGLHLTVRSADRFIETALNEVIGESKVISQQLEIVLIPDRLNGLPFAATRWEFFIGPASLFLAAIFGKATDPAVDPIYAQLAANVTKSSAFRSNAAAMHNALRALVVHPDDRFRPATRSAVSWFASQQTPHGDWGSKIPFFQAFNAMAHLSIPEANAQFDNALKHVVESQNRDGTWGSADKEWQTFLVVHALRKKGIFESVHGVDHRLLHKHRGRFTEGLLDSRLVLKELKIKAGQTILDAGCGNGYMAKRFSKKVGKSGKVYALDLNTHFIEVLKNEVEGTNIEAIEGDITKPTWLKASSIDIIYLSTVFHVFSNQQKIGFFQEVKRLLKPNAFLAIIEIDKKETPFGPPLNSRYSPGELKKAVPLAPEDTVQVGEHFYMQLFKNF